MNGNGSTPAIDWATMPDWITITEAAQASGYNPDYLRRVMRQGKIAAEKKGTMWWIDRESLQAYMALVESLGTRRFGPGGLTKTTGKARSG